MLEGLDFESTKTVKYYIGRTCIHVSYYGVYLMQGLMVSISTGSTYLQYKLNKLLNFLDGKKSGDSLKQEKTTRHEVEEDQEVPPPKIFGNSESESDRLGVNNQSQLSIDDEQEVTHGETPAKTTA